MVISWVKFASITGSYQLYDIQCQGVDNSFCTISYCLLEIYVLVAITSVKILKRLIVMLLSLMTCWHIIACPQIDEGSITSQFLVNPPCNSSQCIQNIAMVYYCLKSCSLAYFPANTH